MATLTQKENKINRTRPTIGITGPDKGGEVAWVFTAFGVLLAGGKPVHITPNNPRTADGLQGLIVGGGADVDPKTYQQEAVFQEYLQRTLQNPKKNFFQRIWRFTRWIYYPALFFVRKLFSRKPQWSLDHARDHLEFQLIDQAIKKNLPLLGICRGSQLLNVYFRGTLHQEIDDFYKEEPNPSSIFPVKKITFEPGSKLAQIIGCKKLKVNALHHQAVNSPGKGLEVVARESNGVVQAIEHVEREFVLGVQWHPEYLPRRQEQRRLFQALVQKAREVNLQIEKPDMEAALAQPRSEKLKSLDHQVQETLLNSPPTP
ncbi:gamma-glutamyl-gamma-aminobutyrate hydrolase family protein [Rufibacter latericius]|uniref:Gamma-glutamyl-gamma-aminobutyrate hydrolase family protein n=1 Tax=Rufibacter latericius TaxID=2487040 RepID=A0A3M9MB36_9BACT|nr:gamma-glutamyl-gamma-aminobutyrate hydrolase family protein [Rufibacter latericius]RNI22377.1 gamma-glutamyl-gamma-aminobutyrate hydrolase family protein [Rufibacter latericius]